MFLWSTFLWSLHLFRSRKHHWGGGGCVPWKVGVCTETCFRRSSVTLQDPVVTSFDGRLFWRTLGIWRTGGGMKPVKYSWFTLCGNIKQESEGQPGEWRICSTKPRLKKVELHGLKFASCINYVFKYVGQPAECASRITWVSFPCWQCKTALKERWESNKPNIHACRLPRDTMTSEPLPNQAWVASSEAAESIFKGVLKCLWNK